MYGKASQAPVLRGKPSPSSQDWRLAFLTPTSEVYQTAVASTKGTPHHGAGPTRKNFVGLNKCAMQRCARGERCVQSQVQKGGRRTRVLTDTGKQGGDWCCSKARCWYLYAWHQYIATTAALCPLAVPPPLLPVVRTTHSIACALASCHLSPEFCRVERGFSVVA